MAKHIDTRITTGFDSPLHLWIEIWQRQLVNGRA
jgi:hypothetical protein